MSIIGRNTCPKGWSSLPRLLACSSRPLGSALLPWEAQELWALDWKEWNIQDHSFLWGDVYDATSHM